jgi:hypothetical protein
MFLQRAASARSPRMQTVTQTIQLPRSQSSEHAAQRSTQRAQGQLLEEVYQTKREELYSGHHHPRSRQRCLRQTHQTHGSASATCPFLELSTEGWCSSQNEDCTKLVQSYVLSAP